MTLAAAAELCSALANGGNLLSHKQPFGFPIFASFEPLILRRQFPRRQNEQLQSLGTGFRENLESQASEKKCTGIFPRGETGFSFLCLTASRFLVTVTNRLK
jgi:hypothetical protein